MVALAPARGALGGSPAAIQKSGPDRAKLSFDDFEKALGLTDQSDVDALFGLGSAWASWVQANSGDWNAIADIPKVQALMERVVLLSPEYES